MNVDELIPPKAELLQLITAEQAWHYAIVPQRLEGNTLVLYADAQGKINGIDEELEILLGKSIALETLPSDTLYKLLGKHYRREGLNEKTNKKIDINEGEDFLVKLIKEAKSLGSSDIHIEPYEDRNRIRMRIDGMLVERYIVNKADYPGLINKIKIKSNLDIAEKRLPQDGRIYFENGGNKFDIRVSVLPTLYGEKVVMRLLRNDASNIDLETVGMGPEDLENYLEGVRKPHGILLISGPTGSGKTTTLYATLKLLNKEVSNILTVEDPIEYTLEGINQVQVKESIGLTFARALRTFLRQDPDIIMVGEIRDAETATIAIRAALTGHLVLSTIHTNSAWGSVSRLIDMDVPPFLLSSTLNTTVAQRLVRLLCEHCKKEEPFDNKLFPRHFKPSSPIAHHYKAVGCERCYYVGYRGRKAIFEVIPIDFDFAEDIKNNVTDVTKHLKERGIPSLKDNAFRLFQEGLTSLDEVYPILSNQ